MARIRYLKPEFFTDEDLADLPMETRLTFAGLWCYADKAGRLEDRPKFLKAMIFPYDKIDMDKQLDALNHAKQNGSGFIRRYEVNGLHLIQILTWTKHQKPHHTEKDSDFPPAPPLKGMEKGMEKQLTSSSELSNVQLTVKEPLSLKQTKIKYLDYVFLTEEQYTRLISDFGKEDANWMIAKLDNYIGTSPKKRNKYDDHNRVLRGWVLEKLEEKKAKSGTTQSALFGTCKKCHRPNIELIRQGLCAECTRSVPWT